MATPRPDQRADAAPALERGALEDRLKEALTERDEALAALAAERELTNALRLRGLSASEPEPPAYPETAAPGTAPLRYLMVDAANDTLKSVLGPMQSRARAIAEFFLKTKG